MASPSPRRLVREQTFECDPETKTEDLSCIICKKLRSEVYQSSCKCIYCDACINKFLSDGGKKYCFGGKTECTEEFLVLDKNVVRNPGLRKDIMRTKVRCPNTSCLVTGNLDDIRQHFKECVKQTMSCPYYSIGCDTPITCKDSILNHLNTDELEHAELVMEWIKMETKKFQQIQKEVSTLKDELKEKDKQNEDQNTKMQSLEKKLKDKEDKIEKLSGEVDFLQIVSKTSKEKLVQLEGTMNHRYTESNEGQISDLFRQFRTLNDEIRSMKQDLERTKNVLRERHQ